MTTLRITPPRALSLRVSSRGKGLQLGGASRPLAVLRVTTGLTGAPGSSGQAQISADAGNALTQGSDQRLFVPSAGDLTYTHQQNQASADWLVTHGLGKFPSVTVIDSAGDQVDGDPVYIDQNSLRMVFSSAFSGRAFLN
jgi:hypothetical protein